MVMARPKDIGTLAETAVVKYLRLNGFPHAERRALAGVFDLGDIVGTPGVAWEVKGGQAAKCASDGQVADWLAETERERVNSKADIGVLVLQRAGVGAPNAGRWWAVLRYSALPLPAPLGLSGLGHQISHAPVRLQLATAVVMLREMGYGERLGPLEATA